MNKIFYTKNEYHLGDNIFCCIVFCKIKDYIEQNNITINHYCNSDHIVQINEFTNSKNINILPLSDIPQNETIIDMWIASPDYSYRFFTTKEEYDVFLCKFYNNILNIMNIPIEFKSFVFDNDDLSIREKQLNEQTDNYYANYNMLIINGTPRSGQVPYNKEEWDSTIQKLSQKYNIITTQKVDGIKCTRDHNLTARDIAAISGKAEIIIAIDSGVAAGIYNKSVVENVKYVYYLCTHDKCYNSFPNFIKKNNITELLFLMDDVQIESMYVSNLSKLHNIFSIAFFIFIFFIFIIFMYHKKMYSYLSKCKSFKFFT